ncbi:LPS-assembly protein LptD [Flavobacterium salilacus subsp. salilacus]|uniref:putative LPS assembly protein LptD n=1 Tax=Flavobacterium TaxID=237 RepID=UPI0010752982|nr:MULTISPECIES: putative LPS assembly protein LptD [Flavobacterium]KAF2519241.1 LPS-assembly protein LptD [Flavobacterium salilacus subsp. salilacus]MBE1613424.1 LPS-assembly protein LptD [Flavobacterium sp. SaA2.13]
MTLQKISHIFTKIVLKPLRTNLFHIVLSAIFLTIGSSRISAQEITGKSITVPAEKENDTIPKVIAAELQEAETVATETKIIAADTVKNKSGLDAIVKRVAEDYEELDQETKMLTLYNKAELYYKDIELKAGIIKMNYETNEVFAGRIKDSLGNYSQMPYFKQGNNVVEADSIHFNTVSKKARIWNSRSDQGEFRVKGEITKKENDSVYYIKGARFTTSKNIDDPEYYFYTNKIKLVPGKKVVIGFTNMVIADVPTPLALPFAFFPMTDEAESGFIVPTFGENNNQGYFLQNGGYYLALSDYYDLAVLGDYYTNGSYGLRFQSAYAKRYKFRGNINIRFENNVQSERGFPDYVRSRQYNIQWSHNQDAKANPNSRFSASVNLGSSQYYRQSQNLSNIGASLNNTLQSSVSYSKTFQTVPQVNVSLSATHSQNTNTETINMTLPTLQASVDRIFPFAADDAPKKGIIKNVNLQYNLRGENRIATTDSLFFKPQMFRDAKSGLQHTIPLSTNFKIFKHFSVSAGSNFQETWVMNTIERFYNPNTNEEETRDLKGFESYRTYNFSSSIGTTIYGTFNFGESKKIQAIRHVIRPSVSYTYTPSFDQYYDRYEIDETGTAYRDYTRFEGGLFGAPGKNLSNSIGLSVNNTFEAKVRNDEDPDEEAKKIMLLNNLNFSTSYNMAADSLAWSPLRVTAGTNLFKQKMNINFGTTLDPYAIDNAGQRIDTYNIDNGGSLFRMTSANVTVNYSFSSKDGESGGGKSDDQTARNGGREDDLFGTATDLSDRRKSMFDEEDEDTEKSDKSGGTFFNAKLPWDLRLAYSLTYSNNNRQSEITGNSIMVSGNVDLTPRWKMGFSSGYDFVQKGVTFTQLRFERDLLSWRMDFNWVPFGDNTYWGFFIGIKSSVLSDIKYDKRQVPDRVLGN